MDMAAAAGFDWDVVAANAQRVRPGMRTLGVSVRSGAGMTDYLELLQAQRRSARGHAATATS
jgi:Ni2+-binding GTPase involved in maturation of urease and hydrogenase